MTELSANPFLQEWRGFGFVDAPSCVRRDFSLLFVYSGVRGWIHPNYGTWSVSSGSDDDRLPVVVVTCRSDGDEKAGDWSPLSLCTSTVAFDYLNVEEELRKSHLKATFHYVLKENRSQSKGNNAKCICPLFI